MDQVIDLEEEVYAFPPGELRRMKQAYLASVSFVDHIVGKILTELR